MTIRLGCGLAMVLALLVMGVHAQLGPDQRNITLVHKPGYCTWFGQCGDTPYNGQYNCVYNGPAKRFADNRTMFDLMQKTCPKYINQTHPNASVACCDYAQLDTLVKQEQLAVSLFARCPACLKNFYEHFCATTCDPNQSLFMNYLNYSVKTLPSGENVSYVKAIDVYVTMDYAERIYNSCSNVEFPGEGSKVISLMCGGSDCSPTKWLDYLGSPELDHGEAPFLMDYHYEPNTTVPGYPNMSARSQKNAGFYKCNSSDPNVACSCSDCPANNTCPPPPDIVIVHFPFKTVAIVIGSVGGVITIAIWLTALISAFIHHGRKSGYGPIGQADTSQYGSTGDDENDSSTSSVGSINSDDIEDAHEENCSCQSCCRIGAIIENYIKKIFYNWGKFAAQYWYVVLLFCVLFCAGLSCGMFFFNVTTDPVKLWSAPTSRARVEKEYFDSHFTPFYRTEQLIITAPELHSFIFHPPGIPDANWNIGPVMQMEVLKEVYYLQEEIKNLMAEYVMADGKKEYITLNDICFKPLLPDNANCTIQSVLNYFQNDYVKLENVTADPFGLVTYNASYHIHYCTRNPSDIKGYNEAGTCLAAYGAPIDPNTVLGGFKMESNGKDYDYDSAEALVLTFIVNNHDNDEDNRRAEAWEKVFLEFMTNYTGEYIQVAHTAERALEDELNRESKTDIFTILISYILMFLYITLFLGHIRSLATILVDMKILLGFFGVLLVLVAVTSSLGFFSYIGITASLIVLEVVPFLVLAVGVDNLFILVHSYERQAKKFTTVYKGNLQQMPIKELIGRTVGEVAPSLLLTSLSETSAFLLGGISTMPAVRTFSFYAGTAVFFNFLLQISVFVSMMSLDARRQISNRYDLVFCKLKDKFDPRIGKDFVHWLMKFFAKIVLHWLVRPFVLLFFGFTLTGCAILCFRIDIGLDQTVALPKDSYLLPYFSALNEYLHVGPPVYFVIKDGYNYTSEENQNKICSSAGCDTASFGAQISVFSRLPNYTRIAEPPLLWLDTYYQWISPNSDCCGITTNNTLCHDPTNDTDPTCVPCLHRSGNESDRPTEAEFTKYLHWFLSDNPTTTCASGGHAAFSPAVQLKNNTNETHILATYAMTYHTILKKSPDYIDALIRARELGANLTTTLNITVFPYSIFYVYYEQYLTIVHDMGLNIGVSLAAVFFVSFLLLGLNLWAAFMVLFIVSSIIMHMLGSMSILGINANAVSLVNLVMTVGISVEFCSHIIRWFVSCSAPTRQKRAISALAHMGASVFSGITVTKFIGVFVLLFAKSQIFEVYYFRMYMCMLLWGALHGLVLLPVLLSYIGPPYCPVKISPPYSDKFLQIQSAKPSQPQSPPVLNSKPPLEPQLQPNGTPQAYPAPTYARQYPTLPDMGTYDGGGQQYPAATRPREQANEHTRLIDS